MLAAKYLSTLRLFSTSLFFSGSFILYSTLTCLQKPVAMDQEAVAAEAKANMEAKRLSSTHTSGVASLGRAI
jgi:hypothetical protein